MCCLLAAGSCAVRAQTPAGARPASQSVGAATRKSSPAVRLLDSNDGLAILGAALETRHKSQVRSDCSHLVHSIYEKAGFPYKYQSSSDLYAGDEDFQRVSQPQAGDLIVWPGHAGIVVNPAQHTFYSALRSGFGVQPYDSVYWKGRGRPRFLRYIKARPASVLAARHVAAMKPTAMKTSPSVERTEIANSEATEPVTSQPASSLESPHTVIVDIPAVIFVEARRPKADHVKAVLAAYFDAANHSTASLDTSGTRLMIAFDSFEVQKVHLSGDHGWVQVRFRGMVMLAGDGHGAQKTKDTQRFVLRRVIDERWEVTLPDTAYLPREVAVRGLAHQLATLTDASPNTTSQADQRAQLARWLNTLLDETRSH